MESDTTSAIVRSLSMDLASIHILTLAVDAARAIRSNDDMEEALANIYAALGLQPPQPSSDPLSIRIVRLVLAADHDEKRLSDAFKRVERLVSRQEPPTPPDDEEEEELVIEDEEARRLVEMHYDDQLGPGYSLFYEGEGYLTPSKRMGYFPPFRILDGSVVRHFHGPIIVRRNGQELPAQEALPPQEGDEVRWGNGELPKKVRGLIDDDPFETPTLFEIETGPASWDVYEICCAFADQYEEIAESRGSRLWSDLWIEDLIYYPEHQLIHAELGT